MRVKWTASEQHTHLTTLAGMKVVVLGQGGVGKSCCTLRYLFGTFQAGYDPTVGASLFHHRLRMAVCHSQSHVACARSTSRANI